MFLTTFHFYLYNYKVSIYNNSCQQHIEPTCFKTAHFHITCIYSSHVTFHWLKKTQFINCLKIKTYLFCFLEFEVLIHLIENVIYLYFESCGWIDIHFSLFAALAFHSLLFLAQSQRLLVFGCFFWIIVGPLPQNIKHLGVTAVVIWFYKK